ncbi:hypothetical protein BCR32DRAFT_327691 [Anaeromyces robustus]|uniref:DNA polymerase V n=1 Tax=Anaeromyces robustus TaxID=1754192 RepID=A0A1Y1X3U2_9FUNG|nr:hypothetical protein BCR32DRAFT_327691 [Anaeromyces robustus]|eukprot:ORX80479.1 hypothetical protein BCR32DRAFT_327691 [Anaeromyces robustus]
MSTLQYFWDLASINTEARNKAAVSLIKALYQFQEQYQEDNKDNWDEYLKDTSVERLETLCSPDVLYALKRLIRGLPSSRDSARQGFSVALTELLSMLSFITISDVLALLEKATETSNGMKAQEEKEMLFGKLFGVASIIQSGIIEHPNTTEEELKKMFEYLLMCSNKKSYLKESSFKIIILLFSQIKKINNKNILNHIIEEILKDGVNTPEELAFTIKAQELYPKYDYSKVINWKHTNILHSSNSSKLCTILKESSYTHPHIHFVWNIIFDKLFNSNEKDMITLQDLWLTVVDECLFNSTYERKYLGFSLFKIILPKLSTEKIPFIFAPNFMRSLINNLSINKTYLHKLALQLIQDLIKIASEDSTVAIALIAQLTGKHGNQNFDKITKTKTIDSIIATLNIDGIKSYIDYLRNIFLDQDSFESDTKKVEAHRTWVVDQLVSIIKNQKIPKNDEIYLSIFEFLFVNGFCVVEKESKKAFSENLKVLPKPEDSEKIQELCRSRFLTVLGESLNSPSLNTSEEIVAPSTQFLQIIDKLSTAKNIKFLVELDKEAKAAKANAKNTLNTISKKLSATTDKEEIMQLKAFESLLVHLAILIHSDTEEAIANIDDIVNCYIRIFPAETKKSKKNAKVEEEEANPIEVLVDVLLSFLLKPSLLLRNLTEKVFKAFCGKLTKNAITLIINVLNPEESANIIEENDDEDNMDVDKEEDGDIIMEDGDDDDDDDLDIEDDDNDEEVDEELRRKIQAVLQKKDPNNADNLDEEEEELSDLNDDEMLDFDEKLAEIFKQRKIIKNSRRDSKQQILHFKFKVLEMLDIFIKKQSTNVLVLELVMPLLHLVKQLYGSHDQQQLYERVQSLLKNRLLKIKDYPKNDDVNTKELFELLEEVNKFAEKCNEPELCNLAGEVSIFIVKVILGNNIKKEKESNSKKSSKKSDSSDSSSSSNNNTLPNYDEKVIKKLSKFYGELLEKFMTKNHTNLRPGQFTMIIQRYPMVAWEFVDIIVEYLSPKPLPNSNAIKVFQLSQAYRFLEILFNTLSKQDEEKYLKKVKSIIPKINAAQAEVCEAYQQTIQVKDDKKDNSERKITKISQQRLKDISKSLNNISKKVKKMMKDDTTFVIDTTEINSLRSAKK